VLHLTLLDSLALLDSLSFSLRWLKVRTQARVQLTLYLDHTHGRLHCHACSPRNCPLHGGHYYKAASRFNKVLLRVRPSLRCEMRCALNTPIAVLATGWQLVPVKYLANQLQLTEHTVQHTSGCRNLLKFLTTCSRRSGERYICKARWHQGKNEKKTM